MELWNNYGSFTVLFNHSMACMHCFPKVSAMSALMQQSAAVLVVKLVKAIQLTCSSKNGICQSEVQ